jgi:hypothetical protein
MSCATAWPIGSWSTTTSGRTGRSAGRRRARTAPRTSSQEPQAARDDGGVDDGPRVSLSEKCLDKWGWRHMRKVIGWAAPIKENEHRHGRRRFDERGLTEVFDRPACPHLPRRQPTAPSLIRAPRISIQPMPTVAGPPGGQSCRRLASEYRANDYCPQPVLVELRTRACSPGSHPWVKRIRRGPDQAVRGDRAGAGSALVGSSIAVTRRPPRVKKPPSSRLTSSDTRRRARALALRRKTRRSGPPGVGSRTSWRPVGAP